MKNVVRELRAERGLSQQQLGDLVGVSRQAIIAIETERHDPSLDLAYRIAAVFELQVEEVFVNLHRKRPKR